MYFSYDGTAYHGWQIQPGAVSVQEVLGGALSTILRRPTEVVGAGRTDAGVHAARMVAHFDAPAAGEEGALLPAGAELAERLNRFLPRDIAVERICPVVPEAHARFSAVSRTYKYYIARRKSPFGCRFSYYYKGALDVAAMNRAASLLLGRHDFTSFSKLHTDVKTNFCRLSRAFWQEEDEGARLVFTIEADRFLRNMVRAVVGTLLDVGRGKMPPEGMCRILEARDRCAAGSSAPACGLFLAGVDYPQALFLPGEAAQ